jgi:hypothetical protein
MPWQILVSGSPAIIEVIYDGVVAPSELAQAFTAALAAGQEHKSLLYLANLSSLKGGHSIVDLLEIVSRIDSLGIDRRMREAIVVPGNVVADADAQFYETACRNRGFNARLFTNRDEGIAWLRQSLTAQS